MKIAELRIITDAAVGGTYSLQTTGRNARAGSVVLAHECCEQIVWAFDCWFAPEVQAPCIVAWMNVKDKAIKVLEAAKAYHQLAAGPYDPSRTAEFLERQAELGKAIEDLESDG